MRNTGLLYEPDNLKIDSISRKDNTVVPFEASLRNLAQRKCLVHVISREAEEELDVRVQ